MKRSSFIILLSLFFVLLGYYTFLKNSTLSTFSYFIPSSSSGELTYQLINDYKQGNENTRKAAETEIKKICLRNSGYENWIDYLDYININLYESNVTPTPSKELIISTNLSKDLAVVCIYEDTGEFYEYSKKIDNLLPIENIQFINIPNSNYNFLIIYQVNDERLGAYLYRKFLDIYMYTDENFIKIMNETIYSEEIYRNIWIDRNARDNWIKKIVDNKIDFVMNQNLVMNVSVVSQEYRAPGQREIPPESEFELTNEEKYKYTYFWNEEFRRFSLYQDTLFYKNKKVLIIKDFETTTSNEHINMKNKFEIITSSGKKLFINKNDIIREK